MVPLEVILKKYFEVTKKYPRHNGVRIGKRFAIRRCSDPDQWNLWTLGNWYKIPSVNPFSNEKELKRILLKCNIDIPNFNKLKKQLLRKILERV
jgi:hypothetical protein